MLSTATATTSDGVFDTIPIVDIGNVSTPEERVAVAREIRDACINVGFFYISGHGIPQETIDNIFSTMKAYFALPLETKMKLHEKVESGFVGYSPFLGINADPASGRDLHEGFKISSNEAIPKEMNKSHTGITWPSEPAGFREAHLDYYHAALNVGKLLFHLFAIALDLPETYFDDKIKNGVADMRIAHYPPQPYSVPDGSIGLGAHSDFLCFTMLWQQPGVQALQILNSKNQWINATPIPGTLVINIADLLSQWTNGIFKSTVHRVINMSGMNRYSIPMFFGTDDDVLVEPLPSCVSADRPAKYEPIKAGDYLQKRLREIYSHSTPPS